MINAGIRNKSTNNQSYGSPRHPPRIPTQERAINWLLYGLSFQPREHIDRLPHPRTLILYLKMVAVYRTTDRNNCLSVGTSSHCFTMSVCDNRQKMVKSFARNTWWRHLPASYTTDIFQWRPYTLDNTLYLAGSQVLSTVMSPWPP